MTVTDTCPAMKTTCSCMLHANFTLSTVANVLSERWDENSKNVMLTLRSLGGKVQSLRADDDNRISFISAQCWATREVFNYLQFQSKPLLLQSCSQQLFAKNVGSHVPPVRSIYRLHSRHVKLVRTTFLTNQDCAQICVRISDIAVCRGGVLTRSNFLIITFASVSWFCRNQSVYTPW